MIRVALLAAALLLSGEVAGQETATLSWTAPTKRTDGTALTDLAGFKLYWGTAPGDYTTSLEIDNPGVTEYRVDGLDPSTQYYFAATALDSAGVESEFSNEVAKLTGAPLAPPEAPDVLELTVIEPTAYKIRQVSDGTFSMAAFGTVPVGTPCDGAHNVDGYRLVPTARDVGRLASRFDVWPVLVFARCE